MATHWTAPLPYWITPKSGPVRQIRTLMDANHAIANDLPRPVMKKRPWLRAGWVVISAANSGRPEDIEAAAEALVNALDAEGWMTRQHTYNVAAE
jgi:hypothetical protein